MTTPTRPLPLTPTVPGAVGAGAGVGGRTSPSLRRRLIGPAVAAVVVQTVVAAGDVLPAVDTLVYLESGRSLVEGDGFTRFGGPELHFPPLVPAALGALLEATGSEVRAVQVWSVLSALALTAAVTALARRLWDDDTTTVAAAWIGGTLSGLGPLLVRRGSGSEGITAALLLTALVVVLGPPASVAGRRGLAALAGGGALAGLAYLARPEALLPALVMGLALLVQGWRGRDRRLDPSAAIAFGVGLALLVGPYVTYLHSHTGSWSPTSKSQDVSVEAWRAVAEDDRNARDQILYAIDASGAGLADDTTSLTGLARQHPRAWLGIVGVNVRTLAELYLLPGTTERGAIIPLPLLAAAGFAAWRSRRRRAVLLAGAIGALPLLTCTVFFTQPRYVVTATAVAAAFAAGGVVDLVRRLPRRALRAGAVVVLTGLMASSLLTEARPLLPWEDPTETTDQVRVGEWLAENTEPDDRVMTRSFHIQYYGRRPVVALPASGYAEMMAFARARGVHYLVADERTIRTRRAELYDELMVDPDPPGLEEVATFSSGRRLVRIFRLEPSPVASDLPPLPLGFVGD